MPCFPLPFEPHNHPKLPSFLKPFSFARCYSSSSSSSPLPFNHEEDGGTADNNLNNHHVIIFEIRQGAMMKAKSRPRGFVIVTAEQLGWVISPTSGRLLAAPTPKASKAAGDAENRRERIKGYDGDDESEEFFSVRSCLSRCSGGSDERWWEERGVVAAVWDEWFSQCEGWPFGLWRHPQVLVLPPLPRSPSDSWTWHKRNLCNAKAWQLWGAA